MTINLHDLLLAQQKILVERAGAADVFAHPGAKGDIVEFPWIDLVRQFLPERYCVNSAFILDSNGDSSDQIDLVIYDRQFSPLLFEIADQRYIPAESVYAVFEIKPELNREHVLYAADKVASVRTLHRTSAEIKHAGGTFQAKPPQHIIGGLLAVRSGWNPAFGDPFEKALLDSNERGRLDLGCALYAGGWDATYGLGDSVTAAPAIDPPVTTSVSEPEGALMSFLLALFRRLQAVGTVPAIDLAAYGRSLRSEAPVESRDGA